MAFGTMALRLGIVVCAAALLLAACTGEAVWVEATPAADALGAGDVSGPDIPAGSSDGQLADSEPPDVDAALLELDAATPDLAADATALAPVDATQDVLTAEDAPDTAPAAPADAADTQPDGAADSGLPDKPTKPLAFSTQFAEPTWDSQQWQEYDASAGGAGAAAGLVRQKGALLMDGNNKWGANGLATLEPWSRAIGDLHFSATVTPQTCQGMYGYALGFGDFSHGAYYAEAPGAAYRIYANGGYFHLRYTEWQPGKAPEPAQETTLKVSACVPGESIELHLLVRESSGASAWVGANSAAAVEIKAGSFDQKPMWLQHYSSGATMTVTAAAATRPVAVPGAPANLTLSQANGKATLQWAAAKQNGSAITDYAIRCTDPTGQDVACDAAVSSATSAVLSLPAGLPYQLRVAAKNGLGQGPESEPITFMPLADQPVPPTAFQVKIAGEPASLQVLKAQYQFADANGDAAAAPQWRWQTAPAAAGPYADLPGATQSFLAPTSAELGKWLRVGVLPVAQVAPAAGQWTWSAAIGPVAAEKPYLNHILSTGESVSLGVGGGPPLSVTQPYQNVQLADDKLVPLIEKPVETPSSGMANQLTLASPGKTWDFAVTRHGQSATLYIGLAKGSPPFATGMKQVQAVAAAAKAQGQIPRVIAVTAIDGEADGGSGWGTSYSKSVQQWQADYQQEVSALTGQTGVLPMFIDQLSAFGALSAGPTVALAQLEASLAKPGAIFLVGPRYQFDYPDKLHLDAPSYRRLGAYFGKVMGRVFFQGEAWLPLSPLTASRKGKVITLTMHVPNPPLVLDTQLMAKRSQYGFEYVNSKESIAITAVSVAGSAVTVTLASEPAHPGEHLRYACAFVKQSGSGALVADAPGGNVRDSDSTPGPDGKPLYNWAIHFDVAVQAAK